MNTTILDKPDSPESSPTLPKTVECVNCHSVLITRGVSAGQQARCGRCGNLFRFGKVDKVATDRLAWRSFWLGLASVLFLFLTGVPAMYYGIRSLMRMRFVRPKKSDRVAALAGTAMGGCFGVFLGFFLAIIGIVIAIAMLTVDKTDVTEEVEARMANFMTIEFPDDVRGRRARVVLTSQHFIDFDDAKEEDETPTFYLHFVHHEQALALNQGNVDRILRGNRYPRRGKLDREQAETYRWSIDGKPVEFKRQVYIDSGRASDQAESDPEAEVVEYHHYVGLAAINGGFYGFALTVNMTDRDMSEADVQAFFESIQLAKQDN